MPERGKGLIQPIKWKIDEVNQVKKTLKEKSLKCLKEFPQWNIFHISSVNLDNTTHKRGREKNVKNKNESWNGKRKIVWWQGPTHMAHRISGWRREKIWKIVFWWKINRSRLCPKKKKVKEFQDN